MTEEEFKRTVAEATGLLNGIARYWSPPPLPAPPVAPGVEHVLDNRGYHWRRRSDGSDSWYRPFLGRGPLTLQVVHEQFGPLQALTISESPL